MARTLAQLRTILESELDLEDEDFVSATDVTNFINMGIQEAEAEIHKLGLEDEYFRASADLGLTTSQGTYDYPSDIYADKILEIIYDAADRQYEILRLKGTRKLSEYQYLRRYGTSTTLYKYLPMNSTTSGRKINLAPVSFETSSNATIWYIRHALQLSANSDVCDIPFENFILQFARDKIMNKERYMLDAPPSAALEVQRKLMIEALSEQVPDGHNEIEQDLSHYEESV